MIEGPHDEEIFDMHRPRGITDADVAKMFQYQSPTPQAKVRHADIDKGAKDFAYDILNNVPECPEQTLAIRHLQMARMWANAGIALNHDKL